MKQILNCCFFTFLTLISLCQAISNESTEKPVLYSEFGAVGDGTTDDFNAIFKAHETANRENRPVRADAGASYYIGKNNKAAVIMTDTDWQDAKFILDDSKIEPRNSHIFIVASKNRTERITSIKSLKKNQQKIDLSLAERSFVFVSDSKVKRYIRYGLNQNNGTAQRDVFLVDRNGKVDMRAPIVWNFDNITSMTATPIDSKTLTIRGGNFTTIANRAESRYTYYNRGINIVRSNVLVDGVTHKITDELENGAPYGGFFVISSCCDVTIQNCKLSGHKTYRTIGAANAPVSMGTYDISVNSAINVTFRNCSQFNDIHDRTYWGIFGSNFCKNITFDRVSFSRFDAHMGVTNATIKNSVLGHQGINLIGFGTFTIENTKVYNANFLNLRGDYGSTFDGNIIIRNCEYTPRKGSVSDAVLINGGNSGQHDFGYVCYMPRKIVIDGLVIHDKNPVKKYNGPKIFSVTNPAYKNEQFKEKYPYQITKEVQIKNVTSDSALPLIVSNNKYMFRNVKIVKNDQK